MTSIYLCAILVGGAFSRDYITVTVLRCLTGIAGVALYLSAYMLGCS